MSAKRLSLILLALSTMVAVSSAFAASGDSKPFKITSTLDGKTVLPHRIHWLARPVLPAAQVSAVDFLIDGKLRWSERNPPYTYGDDGNWLVTSWLTPGTHRFTARARATNGRTAQRTTIARVLAAPAPPRELVGTWKRFVDPNDPEEPPAGDWILTVNAVGWRIQDTLGGANLIDVAYLSTGLLEARGGIWRRHPTPAEEANGGQHVQEGNGWCQDTNAPVRYTWAATADTLTLALDGPDRCGGQHLIWGGTWARLP